MMASFSDIIFVILLIRDSKSSPDLVDTLVAVEDDDVEAVTDFGGCNSAVVKVNERKSQLDDTIDGKAINVLHLLTV